MLYNYLPIKKKKKKKLKSAEWVRFTIVETFVKKAQNHVVCHHPVITVLLEAKIDFYAPCIVICIFIFVKFSLISFCLFCTVLTVTNYLK